MIDEVECRVGCGACCVVPAIDEPYEGHPGGKAAGERCVNLTDDNRCSIWERRPDVCRGFIARRAYCGANDAEAYYHLSRMSEPKKRIPVMVTTQENGA